MKARRGVIQYFDVAQETAALEPVARRVYNVPGTALETGLSDSSGIMRARPAPGPGVWFESARPRDAMATHGPPCHAPNTACGYPIVSQTIAANGTMRRDEIPLVCGPGWRRRIVPLTYSTLAGGRDNNERGHPWTPRSASPRRPEARY
jgi:hypothetical protein